MNWNRFKTWGVDSKASARRSMRMYEAREHGP